MKKINFLSKLFRENKIQVIEPSENICNSYIQKSNDSLESAKILLEHEKLENSVSMSYYCMYNVLLALLFRIGIKCENHSASIILLEKLFEIDNSNISFAKEERINKQYYVNFTISKDEVIKSIKEAEEFSEFDASRQLRKQGKLGHSSFKSKSKYKRR